MTFTTRSFTLVLSLCMAASAAHAGAGDYPMGPDLRITPGSLCSDSKNTRGPQHVPVCKRSVSSAEKWEIIEAYNKLGADINRGNRTHFKIDHFVPLCIGGSNNKNNLWPQHESIFVMTDDVEHMTCELVTQGAMRQAEALELVRTAKLHLDQAPAIKRDLERRIGR